MLKERYFHECPQQLGIRGTRCSKGGVRKNDLAGSRIATRRYSQEILLQRNVILQRFLEIKGVHGSAHRSSPWPKCEMMNRDGGLIGLLKCLSDHVKIVVQVWEGLVEGNKHGVVLPQERILSPVLLNVYIATCLSHWARHGGSNDIAYHDIVPVTNSAQQLQNMLRACERHSCDHKYEFAPGKREVTPLMHTEKFPARRRLCGLNPSIH